MINNILTQSKSTVFEFILSIHNPQDNDTQTLTAAFPSFPSTEDWQNWLSGWTSCGYSLTSQPVLIHTL
ncbi:MAG: hypothetical protein AAFO95_06180 [Cyanobacteria bacterium J06600_6]